MAKNLGILLIHGIGDNQHDPQRSFQRRASELVQELENRFDGADVEQIAFKTVIWQDILQSRQNQVFSNVEQIAINENRLVVRALKQVRLKGLAAGAIRLFRRRVRRFLVDLFPAARSILVSTLADASVAEHRAASPTSAYTQIQRRIRNALDEIYVEAGNTSIPVFVISQSYGAHLISNYIWDAQKHSADKPGLIGIWQHEPIEDLSNEKEQFLKFGTLERFHSTACNIALFLSGLERIETFRKPSERFKWISYWDHNDVLGWPLKELQIDGHDPKKPYFDIVDEEHQLQMEGIFVHNDYWRQDQFLDRLTIDINNTLNDNVAVQVPIAA